MRVKEVFTYAGSKQKIQLKIKMKLIDIHL